MYCEEYIVEINDDRGIPLNWQLHFTNKIQFPRLLGIPGYTGIFLALIVSQYIEEFLIIEESGLFFQSYDNRGPPVLPISFPP